MGKCTGGQGVMALWRWRAKLHCVSHVKVTSIEFGVFVMGRGWGGGDEAKVMRENQSDSQTAQSAAVGRGGKGGEQVGTPSLFSSTFLSFREV